MTIRDRHGPSVSSKSSALGEDALIVAFASFLVDDPTSLSTFLTETGLDPSGLRAALAEHAPRGAILDHIMGDEPLLLAFARHAAMAPEGIVRAILRIRGPTSTETI